ncbi:MAG TPA: MEDS domain-containing protein [Acidimicrobiales bacterium]|nr:MEDS domain-containing protein [Acidimicrobiales bacterium]
MVVQASNEATEVDHQVHLAWVYQHDRNLVEAVTGELASALEQGGRALLVATEAHRLAVEDQLRARGLHPQRLQRQGRLVSLDASGTLARFMVDGSPDPDAFAEVVGTLVAGLEEGEGPLAVYGEMVSVLWDQGQVGAACQLEGLWNGLRSTHRFSLICGYPAGSDQAEPLAWEQVCQLHASVVELGPAPAGEDRRWRLFGTAPDEPRQARRFVAEALRDWGLQELEDSAALVVAELATNAVVHARTGFTVELSLAGERVRIEVSDSSPGVPVPRSATPMSPSGRGLLLIDGFTSSWGTELLGERKVVWAEL